MIDETVNLKELKKAYIKNKKGVIGNFYWIIRNAIFDPDYNKLAFLCYIANENNIKEILYIIADLYAHPDLIPNSFEKIKFIVEKCPWSISLLKNEVSFMNCLLTDEHFKAYTYLLNKIEEHNERSNT